VTPLQESARLIGGHCWSERRAFEIFGGWVPEVDDPAAKVALDRHSAHCAWRARQWEDRLPVLAGVSREDLVAAPHGLEGLADAAARAVGGLEPERSDVATVARLAGAYRVVLPRLVSAYRVHLAAASPVADGPTRRSLGMGLADAVEDWAEGETLLQRFLVDPVAVRAAAETVTSLESVLLSAPPPLKGDEIK
jgi:hypothetical protein